VTERANGRGGRRRAKKPDLFLLLTTECSEKIMSTGSVKFFP